VGRVFGSAGYVDPDQAVIDHIKRLKKKDWSAELLAVDRNAVHDVIAQLDSTQNHLLPSKNCLGGKLTFSVNESYMTEEHKRRFDPSELW
jgi:hypothetical protein